MINEIMKSLFLGSRLSTRCPVPQQRLLSRIRPTASSSYDVAVVGVGAMGSAAAFHAAKTGLKVLGLEQFSVGNQFGSSHGYTRIFRVAHRGNDIIPRLAIRSGALWEELEEDSHKRFLFRCGNLNIGDFAYELREDCDAMGFEYEFFNAKELQEIYPGFEIHDDGVVALLDPQGGFLDSDLIVQTHVDLTRRMNGVISEGERVQNWAPDGSGVRIETTKGVYYAQKLILSAGPWITKTFPESKKKLKVERQVVGWYNSKPADFFTPDKIPTFVAGANTQDEYYYGLPSYQNHGLKIAKYNHLKETMDIDQMDYSVHQKDIKVLEETLNQFFRPEEHVLKESCVCLFTNTPDEKFIIDQHPVHPQVLICSPCSGAGFKFSSVIGQILTEMVTENVSQDSRELLEPFQLSRDALKVKSVIQEEEERLAYGP